MIRSILNIYFSNHHKQRPLIRYTPIYTHRHNNVMSTNQYILRLQISVADFGNSVDISQPPENLHAFNNLLISDTEQINQRYSWNARKYAAYLVHVKFHIDDGHSLISIAIVFQDSIHGLWNIFHHQIKKKFICTCSGKETMLQSDHIWVIHHTH